MRSRLAVLILLGLGCSMLPAEAAHMGTPVPDFGVRTLDGRSFTLQEARASHRAVAIVFLSALCPYARSYSSHLDELNRKYASQGLLLIGVNSNSIETAEEVAAEALRRDAGYLIVKDEGHAVADALNARVTPESFLIDANGRLRYRGRVRSKQGATDLEDAVKALLAGREVRRPETKVFGCAIQRD